MEVAIICNGEFPRREYPRHIISRAGFIICCDGALKPFLHASPKIFGALREPDLVIGDLDSLPASLREAYAARIVHVAEQDDNDMTKAFRSSPLDFSLPALLSPISFPDKQGLSLHFPLSTFHYQLTPNSSLLTPRSHALP